VLLVLHPAPEQIVEAAQRVDLQHRERVAIPHSPPVLEPPAERVHRLHQHAFLEPVVPDQLEKTRAGELPAQNPVAFPRAEGTPGPDLQVTKLEPDDVVKVGDGAIVANAQQVFPPLLVDPRRRRGRAE
jgi:hypothetical protein